MRNSLCHQQFEIRWSSLINAYPTCQQYLTRVLYSCKTSWASYAINRHFTAGIQSSQRAEVSNKMIKEKLTRTSCLTDVVKAVQDTFDKQSKKAILSEFRNEIPMKGLPNIMDEYFPKLDKTLQDFLTPQILQKQRDQIVQSLCYDVILINDWSSLLEITDDSYQENIGREDDYDQPQSLFSSLVEDIPHQSIQEVWKVIRHRGQQSTFQYVIVLDDGSHVCTCLWVINRGIVCRHFFRVMSYSNNARFHITLIPQRWYNDKKSNLSQQERDLIPLYQMGNNVIEQTQLSQPLSFEYLTRIREVPNILQLQNPKQKFGFGMGYAKKALNYAIRADKVDEFVDQMEHFIEKTKEELFNQQENVDSIENMIVYDPLHIQHTGRQPDRYKSGGEILQKKRARAMQDVSNTFIQGSETQDVDASNTRLIQDRSGTSGQGSNNQKRPRLCQKCKQPGHYAPRCPNV